MDSSSTPVTANSANNASSNSSTSNTATTTNNNTAATTTNNNNSNNNTNRSSKKTADTDLKTSIIEFMRGRPFLWNTKHPSYKDHKRREHEFQTFSSQIDCPVQEIKRVWHVLRTNFFRAHKLLLERPPSDGENGERLWKYYLAMGYILEGTGNDDSTASTTSSTAMTMREVRQTRSFQKATSKDFRAKSQKDLNNHIKSFGGTSGGGSSGCTRTNSHPSSGSQNNNNNNSVNNNNSFHNKSTTSSNELSMDADDDHLYARSLTSTLKRFDPTTREIIKLKFQEIIVSYMQQQDVPHELADLPVPPTNPNHELKFHKSHAL